MDERFLLRSPELPAVSLRTIAITDQDQLRHWKNANRRFFFFKGLISRADQSRWFEGYCRRAEDFMFIVIAEGKRDEVGCMGFRLGNARAEVYNVILGVPARGGRGLMSQALRIMCSFALRLGPAGVWAKVLRDNPAVGWYCRNGFHKTAEHEEYFELRLDPGGYRPCTVLREPWSEAGRS